MIKTTGLIIREYYTGENDRIIAILTPNGLIRAFARGSRKIKNTNLGATQLLCFSSFDISKSRNNTYAVNSAKAIEIFFELRQDISKLSLAQYFCEAVKYFSDEDDDCSETLRLTLNCLKFLCTGKLSERLIKAIFELRMTCIAGYTPDLTSCVGCGTEEGRFFFSPQDGGIYCSNCAPVRYIEMPTPALLAARHICYSPFDKIFSFKLDDKNVLALAKMAEKFFVNQAERKFGTLEFYNSLQEKI